MTALDGTELTNKEKGRAKNFFALGLVFWMYGREPEGEVRRIYQQFAKKPGYGDANVKVFKAGYHYGETAEVFQTVYKVPAHIFKPGMYRNITGNEAIALGLVVGADLAGKKLFYSGYPITPASSILHSLAKYKNFGTLTFQAEDEIAAMGAALGAAYGGSIAVTAPAARHRAQGRGSGLNHDQLGRVILNIQRGGPSTGLRRRPSRATSRSRCTAATASRRCRCSRRRARATRSTARSRP
jgi:2-oxoglutarate ferredoxin oxidoreductase subunit alpha